MSELTAVSSPQIDKASNDNFVKPSVYVLGNAEQQSLA